MKRFNYYYPLPCPGGEDHYHVGDNENPGYNIYVRTRDEAERLTSQLNEYEDRVNSLVDELNTLKKTKYLKSEKMIAFETVNLIIEHYIEDMRRTINALGCNEYNDIETYSMYMNRIRLLDTIRQEILCWR